MVEGMVVHQLGKDEVRQIAVHAEIEEPTAAVRAEIENLALWLGPRVTPDGRNGRQW